MNFSHLADPSKWRTNDSASARDLHPSLQIQKIEDTKKLRDLSSDETLIKEANILLAELNERAGLKMREIPIVIRPARVKGTEEQIRAVSEAKTFEKDIQTLQKEATSNTKSPQEFIKAAEGFKVKAVKAGNADAVFQIDLLLIRFQRFQDLKNL